MSPKYLNKSINLYSVTHTLSMSCSCLQIFLTKVLIPYTCDKNLDYIFYVILYITIFPKLLNILFFTYLLPSYQYHYNQNSY